MMILCKNCGEQIPEAKKFCAGCGKPSQQEQQYENLVFDPADIEGNKTIAGLSYFVFFLPLIVCPDSRFGCYHANQALALFLAGLVGSTVLLFIPIVGWVLQPVYSIFIIVLLVIGLLNGLNGKAKELPVIGKLRIVKY